MYVWVGCSFNMVAKMSILSDCLTQANVWSQWGSLTEGLEARLHMCKVFCMHAAIASFPGSPSLEHKYVAVRAWYLFSREHDVIKIAPEFLEQKTFCVLFNQLRVQCSVCMIFDSR